jgi:hypothetical protein
MSRPRRGKHIRDVLVTTLGPLLSIPVEKKHWFRDGYDALVIIVVSQHAMRVALAVSSGGEFVIPDWLRVVLPVLAQKQLVEKISLYLSKRPIWLVPGEQDDAVRGISQS